MSKRGDRDLRANSYGQPAGELVHLWGMFKQHPDTLGVWFLGVTCNEGRGRSSCGEHCRKYGRKLRLLRAEVSVPALLSLAGAGPVPTALRAVRRATGHGDVLLRQNVSEVGLLGETAGK